MKEQEEKIKENEEEKKTEQFQVDVICFVTLCSVVVSYHNAIQCHDPENLI
jgi:hypothetical protein